MARRSFENPKSREHEARRATADLLARIAARRRRARRHKRLSSRAMVVDILVAMATYAGVTVAVILGAIYGICAAAALLTG